MFFTTALKKDQCLWISYKGQSPIKEMMSARYATHKYLAQKHWSRIVVDITALSPMPTAMEVIHLASDVSGELPPDTRVALLVNPEQTEYAKLAECVSRIEGVQFHFFFNREEAKAWVKASPQEKPAPAEKSNNPNPLPCSTLRRQSPKLLALPLAFALFACGCAHYPVNAPLPTVNPATGYRFETAVVSTNSDDTSVILAFSGGGTRAAALSYGVLQELAQTEVGPPNHEHRLLDDVTMVSGVSGGSITAAYYTLWGDRIFSDYESQFLKKHVQAGLFLRLLCPWNLARLTSPRFCSSDLAAEYYDDLLFKGATYADLTPRPGRPFLLVNATDLAIGARFEFSQDQFDLLHSDLS
ncbi:MAG TPA: patatin-like phospholipase family protein, partial [Verrucomicrobiae bacterium]